MGVAGSLLRSTPRAQRVVHESRRRRGIRFMKRQVDRHGVEGAVLAAITKALQGRPTASESAWIQAIEAKRDELAASSTPFEVPPFDGDPALTRTIGQQTAGSKQPRWQYLLFRLVRELRPREGLELGACVGISAAYQGAAMELNGKGRLTSLEGVPALAQQCRDTHAELGLSRAEFRVGRFDEILSDVLAEIAPIDWAFIDGHHLEQPTLDYTEQIMAVADPGAVLVYDDISHSPGVVRAWKTLCNDQRFGHVIDLGAVGVAVVGGPHRVLHVPYG